VQGSRRTEYQETEDSTENIECRMSNSELRVTSDERRGTNYGGNCGVGELLLRISDFDKFFYGEYYEKA
jgi:hypothetical protein